MNEGTDASSSSSNDALASLSKVKEDTSNESIDILRGANKSLGGALRKTKETSKSLNKQGSTIHTTVKKKKNIRKIVGATEEKTVSIKRSGRILDFSNRFFDGITSFFSGKKRKIAAIDKKAEKEGKSAEMYEEQAEGTESSLDPEQYDKEISQLEDSGGTTNADEELEKMLGGLKALDKGVRSQTKKIKSQTHATKQMKILDKDTKKRTDEVTERVKNLK
ncbi:hypothetical protein NEFER03_0736 [Nematocida sp. LUAm3]|nr:hypothetical protein NEFER03_0736 [Nematocida sp. LUAm3]KAI5175195.1 hypothetical protein NEFER02_1156 [Nematocida sp. LUAm2]KAI5178133.1 hypothetical protein NEFER01_1311 [Nematocida sp. LUAm1]